MVRTNIDISFPDFANPSILSRQWLGGLTELLKVSAMAAAYDIPVVPHGSGPYSYHFISQFLASQLPLTVNHPSDAPLNQHSHADPLPLLRVHRQLAGRQVDPARLRGPLPQRAHSHWWQDRRLGRAWVRPRPQPEIGAHPCWVPLQRRPGEEPRGGRPGLSVRARLQLNSR